MFSCGTNTLLKSRSVLRLAGEETLKFLQGLVTRNVMDLGQPSAAPLYAAMLNSKGRQIFDLFMYREVADSTAVLVDCPAETSSKLLSLLTRFKLRSAVTIDDVSKEFCMVASWGASADSTGVGTLAAAMHADPRLAALGLRAPVKASSCEDAQTDETAHREHRFVHGVAEGSLEIPSGSAIPLEYNIDWLNGVSYDKGCYVGQELVARVHFGGLVRKRLYPIVFEQSMGQDDLHDAPILIDGKESSIGTVRGGQGVHGIAHLRISDVEASFKKGLQLRARVNGSDVGLKATIPEWWPKR